MKKILCMLILLGIGAQASAQSIWTRPYTPNRVAVELLHPSLDAGDNLTSFTGAAFLSGTALLSERMAVTAEVPVARHATEAEAISTTESVLGNPYVGLDVIGVRTPLLLELGARLPVVSDTSAATSLGMLTDFDRSDAFAPHRLTTQALLNYRWELTRTLNLRLRGGPMLTVDTEGDVPTELLARYSVQAWSEGDRFIWGLGATGRALVTEGGSFDDRTTHYAGGTFMLNFERVHPGVIVQLPLNSAVADQVDWVMGLTLSVSLTP